MAFEQLSASITISQPGYVYIYLSNEETAPVEVYFDDFKVTQTKSPVIQQDDYYPFGLTFNSYQRENASSNQYQYNRKEAQDELGINWIEYGADAAKSTVVPKSTSPPANCKCSYTDESGNHTNGDPEEEASQGGNDLHTADNLLGKLYLHFQVGGNSDFNLDASTLNFKNTNQRQLGLAGMKPGDRRLANLFDAGINSNSLALGRIWVTLQDNGQFSIENNEFNFDFGNNGSASRNGGTVLAGIVNYNLIPAYFAKSLTPVAIPLIFGGSFNVVFNGTATIPK